MAIWLLKTEPSSYSFADLERDGETRWDGVTNAAALKHLRTIVTGDTALIYHTGNERAWVGTAKVTRGYYVNPDFDDPKLAVIDVAAGDRRKEPVSLALMKSVPELSSWDLIRQGRLSVVPVSQEVFAIISRLAG